MSLWNPLEEAVLAETLEALPLTSDSRVLDIGCGKGRLLLDILQRFGGSGVGVDPHPEAIAAALVDAEERGLTQQVQFLQENFEAERHAAAPFDLTLCLGASQALGTLEEAIPQLHHLLAPQGLLLLADGYWQSTPSADYLSFLGCSESELHTFDALQAHLQAQGFDVLRAHETSVDAWDRYEDAYADNLFQFLEQHPDDPDATYFRERITAWRDAYRNLGRGVLGFGLFLLRRR
ncbi:MAG: SAM-dependent methyltransferase [Planctomycetota bacterium]